ncbi:MAG TPA: TMEM175 family protein [Gemmatimonadales bacterium]|nr:TMEM175 family protein [Gemmatimonadales bacterium]
MGTNRLEAFSDAVIAIIITIMVLELRAPHEPTFAALQPLTPVFLSYLLSFVYIGIYWSNHHHMFHVCGRVTGAVLWANLHFLFWLSLFPFVTGWMGENHFAPGPTIAYGAVLLAAALAYYVLQQTIIRAQGAGSVLRQAVGADWKGKLSPLVYVIGIGATLIRPWLGQLAFLSVALIWLVPDRRIERALAAGSGQHRG